jgi:hypothetical protein
LVADAVLNAGTSVVQVVVRSAGYGQRSFLLSHCPLPTVHSHRCEMKRRENIPNS